MHLSCLSRGMASKGSTVSGSLSSKVGWADDCDCYCRGWASEDGSLEHSLVRTPLPRVDSIVMRLTGSPGDRPARMQSGS